MKLPDFNQHDLFNQLRSQMNAHLVSWSEGGIWNSIDIDEILETTGHDISPEELTISTDGTLEYKGRKVVVYIRDQRVQYQPYKFHAADCQKLTEMRHNDRYHRYVVSNRTDGSFIVNSYDRGRIVEKDVTKKLSICRYCLICLNYDGYANQNDQTRTRILGSFVLDEFFRKHPSQIRFEPKHSSVTAPADEYTLHWEHISRLFRESKNWQCEDCHVSLRDKPVYLHVHHRDGNKNNNSRVNLQALCIACHATIPHHQHLKQQSEYTEYIDWRHKNQRGLTYG